jgi:hypothetical protein
VNCRGCSSPSTAQLKTKIAPFVSERMLNGLRESNVIECLSCGLLWVDVEPTNEDLNRYYKNYWQEEYISHREKHEPNLRDRHAHLLQPRNMRESVEKFIGRPPKKVLDIGGGSGEETPYVGKATVHVFDVAPRVAVHGVKHVDCVEQTYDLVVMAHVLEHVPHPKQLLNFAVTTCDPSGYMYIEVPDEASTYGTRPRLAKVAEQRKEWHEHLTYYDPCSLTMLVRSCGVEVVKLEQFSWKGGPIIRMVGRVLP